MESYRAILLDSNRVSRTINARGVSGWDHPEMKGRQPRGLSGLGYREPGDVMVFGGYQDTHTINLALLISVGCTCTQHSM